MMKKRKIRVADVTNVTVCEPESLPELRELVLTDEDTLYLAQRGLDQVRRTYLLSRRKQGDSKKEVRRLAHEWKYHKRSW